MTNDLPAIQNKRVELLSLFFSRYNFQIPLENQPIDPTLLLVIKAHQRRSCEFLPLSKITNAIDGRDLKIDNTRVRLNAELTLDLGATAKKRASDFNHNAETFLHAVRVLMMTYALVSAGDPIETTWCTYNAAYQHISTVETYSRASAKANYQQYSRVMESELLVRQEWTRVSHAEPTLSLAQIIATVSLRHTLWPTLQEFRTLGKGGGKSTNPPPGIPKVPKKPWTRTERLLNQRKWELKQQGECVIELAVCKNHKLGRCNMARPTTTPCPVLF